MPKVSPHPQQCDRRLQGRRWWDLASESKTIQGQDRRKLCAFGGLWKGRLKSISSRFRETPPAGRPTNCEPSGAGRSWKGGARERADDVFFATGIKRRRSKADFAPTWYARLDSNQRPSESELSGRQRGARWSARVSVELHSFQHIYRKSPEPLQCNSSGPFANSRQIVVSIFRIYRLRSIFQTSNRHDIDTIRPAIRKVSGSS